MGRAPCCDKANVKKGPWSPEEDAKLKSYIDNYGTGGNWIALPQKIGLKRCGKSCRLRWLNYLRPNIKHGGFSEEEDNIICNLYISIGSRWSIIAAQLPGRTDNDIKNYWNTKLKKKLLGMRRKLQSNDQYQAMGMGSDDNQFSEGLSLSSSAMERLQLHMQLHQINPLVSNFFIYNNPALWPNNNLQPANVKQQNYPKIRNDELDNSLDGILSPSDHHHHGNISHVPIDNNNNNNNAVPHVQVQPVSDFQQGDQLDDEFILNNKMGDDDDQFNCLFKEMTSGTAKDSGFIWCWSSNDFDAAKSASNSNSWDSTTSVLQSNANGMLFQDYHELPFNN